MVERVHKRHFKNLLLDGRFQLRYVLLVTGVCVAIAFALGLLIYQHSTSASARIMAAVDAPGMDWLDAATKAVVREQLQSTDLTLAMTMIALGFAGALIVVIGLVVMTHRVAGPLHRMTLYFDSLCAGRLATPGSLRRHDQFHQVFESMRQANESLRQRTAADVHAMRAFLEGAGGNGGEALVELRSLVEEKQARLGPDRRL